eukprot:COSAG05_NODE_24999_length_198_cov_65.343434_1_plen_59_part_01
MLLGVRLWYGFYGSVMASEGAFQGKMEVLCRELGDRAKLIPTDETCDEPVPPASVKHGY